jgi:hypothetical protein
MVLVRTEKQKRRPARWRMKKSPWKAYVLLVLMLISTVSMVRASGDLKNTGTINNTGQMRLHDQAQGLPAVNGGVYEFFGDNQSVPGRTYVDLKLSGTGTKTADADGTVSGTLTVASGVTYDTGPFTTHLSGTLTEAGYVTGKLDKSQTLSGGFGSSNFGNMGTTISWSGVAPGVTTVVRTSGTAQTAAATGKSSIKRYYDITPATNAGLNATLIFKYADVELGGQTAATMSLWKSTDGGATWRNQGGTVDVVQRTITKPGIGSFSRWTASDAAHPLGLMSVEGVAENLAISMGNGQTGIINTSLPMQFVVTTTDAYGSPVKNTAITFAIAGSPSGAVGQKLSKINTVTDELGQANTILTLGDKEGKYTVTAASPFIGGSLVTFNATGIKPAPILVATTLGLTSGNNQIGVATASLAQPYTVTVHDQFGAPMSGVQVKFALSGSPLGSVGQQLVDTLVTTNTNGQAQTTLRLGTKVGQYTVTATSGSLSGSPVTFVSNATAGAVANVTLPLGSDLAGQVLQPVSPALLVQVTDPYGNPISGSNVRYVLTSSPSGATGTTPQDVTIATDSLGRSQVIVVLGSRSGVYTFQVIVGSLPPQTVTITATGGQTGLVASRLVQTSGSGQSGVVATQLASPFVVTVLDTASTPVPGVNVRFVLGTSPFASTGQALTDSVSTTNANGQAQTFLKLGSRVGQYTVTASSGSLFGSPVIFTASATVGAPARLVALSGDRQSSPVNTVLLQPFVVQVTDNQLNPIAGVAVNFGISSAPSNATGQTLDASQRTTDSQGMASVTLTLGDRAGDYRVDATSTLIAGGIASFTGSATSSGTQARTLLLSSGQDQRGVIRSILPQPFVVRTLDANNNPISGVNVQFAIDTIPSGASGQTLSTVSATSDLLGYASTLLTLGDLTGVYSVRATSTGLTGSPITLRTTATLASGAYRVVYGSGDGQSGAVLSQLPNPLVATVLGADGNPVSGQTVTFAIDSLPSGSSGQTLGTTSATSDAQGRATTSITLGNKIGAYRVSASVPGLAGSPISFRLSSTIGLPKTLASIQGSGQIKSIGSTLDNAYVVRVTDVANNPVPGVSVLFAVDSLPTGSTGHSLRVVNSVTDAQGQAQAVLTLGSKVGSYVVSASSTGLDGSPVRFTARATAGAAAIVALSSGDGQTAPVSTELLLPFMVTVTDIGANPIAGSAVTFAIASTPAGAKGQSLRVSNAVTDASGRASAYLTLGDRDGIYSVTATVSGLTPVRFSSTATVMVGDVNGNNQVDIADLTTVIDFILGKIVLTESDSVKADFNKDGRIDIRDVVAMQNALLAVNGVSARLGSAAASGVAGINSTQSGTGSSAGSIGGEFVLTDNGIRFNLTNTVPVKGLELIIRFKDAQGSLSPDEIFDRAKVDSFYTNTTGTELRIVAYNLGNVPIISGDGTLFRLPVKLTDVSGIVSAQMITSLTNNTAYYDEALTNTVPVRLVRPQDLPQTFVLHQNYPNPFNGQTNISYEVMDVAGMAEVSIQVFNVLGEKVKTFGTERHAGGRFVVRWDGTDDRGTKLSSGTYYYRLISGTFVSSKKMIMLK